MSNIINQNRQNIVEWGGGGRQGGEEKEEEKQADLQSLLNEQIVRYS